MAYIVAFMLLFNLTHSAEIGTVKHGVVAVSKFTEGEKVFVLNRATMEKCREYQILAQRPIKLKIPVKKDFFDTTFGKVVLITVPILLFSTGFVIGATK